MELSVLGWILLITFINGLLAFAGLGFYFLFKKNLNRVLIFLVSFTTGALLGGAFIHFLPEAYEGLGLFKTVIITVLGFVLFLILERVLHWHHCHDGKCDRHPFTYLLLWGDAIHNFIDGIIIAGGFLISVPFGIVTSLLILAHELPQEIGDFGVLIYGGFTKGRALWYNFLVQLTAVLGGVLGFWFLRPSDVIYLLPLAAGGFIYIAVADLIPEIFKEKNWVRIVVNLIGIIAGLLVLISGKFLGG
jgi:zinc and cadmium transporter